jgi:hypothetical protein
MNITQYTINGVPYSGEWGVQRTTLLGTVTGTYAEALAKAKAMFGDDASLVFYGPSLGTTLNPLPDPLHAHKQVERNADNAERDR